MQTIHMPWQNKFKYHLNRLGIPRWVWIIFLVLIAIRAVLPVVGLKSINWALQNKLGAYHGHLNDFDLALYRGAYQLQGLIIEKKNSNLPPLIDIGEVDLSIAWRHLFTGEVHGDIEIDRAIVKLFDGSTAEKKQLGNDETKWRDLLDVIAPITIESLEVHNSSIFFANSDITKGVPIEMGKIEFSVADLRSRAEQSLSPFNGSAILQGHAKVKVDGTLDALAKKPRFDVDVAIVDFRPKNVNPIMLHYVPLDLTKGLVSVYSEIAMSRGEMVGYAKVFLKDIDVVAPDQRLKNVKHTFVEIGGAFANWFLRNNDDDTVAALIPFNRKSGKFDIDTSEAFWSSIKNKRDELKREIDNSISLKNLENKKNDKMGESKPAQQPKKLEVVRQ